MRPLPINKSHLPLMGIAAITIALIAGLSLTLFSDPVSEAVKGDRILSLLVVLEKDGAPVASELLFYYPATGKGAILDIPGNTGLILKSLNKVDRIDRVYQKGHAQAYAREIAGLLQIDMPLWVVLDEEGMRKTADYVDGVEMFIPETIDRPGPPRILLAQGTTRLDGDKLVQLASWVPEEEDEASASTRRQHLMQGLMRGVARNSDWLTRPEVFPSWKQSIKSNLGGDGLLTFVHGLAKIDTDHLLLQRITGTKRLVDKQTLLFPHYDGDLARDTVKQTLNALTLAGSGESAVHTVEILNGTTIKGLAGRTAEIFGSFGYDVLSVGNANRTDYETTRILVNGTDTEAAKPLAESIMCGNIVQGDGSEGTADAEFIVVLGSDFNGRYVVGHKP